MCLEPFCLSIIIIHRYISRTPLERKKEVAFPAQQKSRLDYATAAFHMSFRVKSQKSDRKKEKEKKRKTFIIRFLVYCLTTPCEKPRWG